MRKRREKKKEKRHWKRERKKRKERKEKKTKKTKEKKRTKKKKNQEKEAERTQKNLQFFHGSLWQTIGNNVVCDLHFCGHGQRRSAKKVMNGGKKERNFQPH